MVTERKKFLYLMINTARPDSIKSLEFETNPAAIDKAIRGRRLLSLVSVALNENITTEQWKEVKKIVDDRYKSVQADIRSLLNDITVGLISNPAAPQEAIEGVINHPSPEHNTKAVALNPILTEKQVINYFKNKIFNFSASGNLVFGSSFLNLLLSANKDKITKSGFEEIVALFGDTTSPEFMNKNAIYLLTFFDYFAGSEFISDDVFPILKGIAENAKNSAIFISSKMQLVQLFKKLATGDLPGDLLSVLYEFEPIVDFLPKMARDVFIF